MMNLSLGDAMFVSIKNYICKNFVCRMCVRWWFMFLKLGSVSVVKFCQFAFQDLSKIFPIINVTAIGR